MTVTTFTQNNSDGSTVVFDIETGRLSMPRYTYTPPPPRPPFLVGSGQKGTNVLTGAPVYRYNGQMIGLAFNEPGHGINTATVKTAAETGCLPVIMYKDPPDPAILDPLLDQVSAYGIEIWLNYWQEVNRAQGPTPTVYKPAVARQLEIVAASDAGRRGLVHCVEKFANFTGIKGDWHDYWTGLPTLWDQYSQTGYPPPEVMFEVVEDACAEMAEVNRLAGRPYWWGIGESGLVWQQATDPTGRGQAEAHAINAGYIEGRGGRCFIIWDGGGAADFSCTPTARASHQGVTLAATMRQPR